MTQQEPNDRSITAEDRKNAEALRDALSLGFEHFVDAVHFHRLHCTTEAADEITRLRSASEWRPISELKPEDGEWLVTNGNRTEVAFFDSGLSSYRLFSMESHKDLSFAPTHFRPLPSPPDREKGSG